MILHELPTCEMIVQVSGIRMNMKYLKRGTVFALTAGLLSGCAGGQASVAETASPSPTANAYWIVEPTMEFDTVENFNRVYTNRMYTEGTGYSTEWGEAWDSEHSAGVDEITYTGNAIAVCKDGKWGIYDYDGNALQEISISPAMQDYHRDSYMQSPVMFLDSDATPFYTYRHFLYYVDGNDTDHAQVLSGDFRSVSPIDGSQIQPDEELHNYYYIDGEVKMLQQLKGDWQFTDPDVDFSADGKRHLLVELDDDMVWQDDVIVQNDTMTRIDKLTTIGSPDDTFVNGFIRVTNLEPEAVEQTDALGMHHIIPDYDNQIGFYSVDLQKMIGDGCVYEDAGYFVDGYAPVKKNGRWGYIDETGKEVTDFIFADASEPYEGHVYVADNGSYGILDLQRMLDDGVEVNTDNVYGSSYDGGSWKPQKSIPQQSVAGYLVVNEDNVQRYPYDTLEFDTNMFVNKGAVIAFDEMISLPEGTWYETSVGYLCDENKDLFTVTVYPSYVPGPLAASTTGTVTAFEDGVVTLEVNERSYDLDLNKMDTRISGQISEGQTLNISTGLNASSPQEVMESAQRVTSDDYAQVKTIRWKTY